MDKSTKYKLQLTSQKGFSLLESVVALGLLGIVMAFIAKSNSNFYLAAGSANIQMEMNLLRKYFVENIDCNRSLKFDATRGAPASCSSNINLRNMHDDLLLADPLDSKRFSWRADCVSDPITGGSKIEVFVKKLIVDRYKEVKPSGDEIALLGDSNAMCTGLFETQKCPTNQHTVGYTNLGTPICSYVKTVDFDNPIAPLEAAGYNDDYRRFTGKTKASDHKMIKGLGPYALCMVVNLEHKHTHVEKVNQTVSTSSWTGMGGHSHSFRWSNSLFATEAGFTCAAIPQGNGMWDFQSSHLGKVGNTRDGGLCSFRCFKYAEL